MRFVPFVVLAGCASAPKPVAPEPAKPVVETFGPTGHSPEAPLDGPLVALATRHTFFILATEQYGTECRAWTVEQSKDPKSDLAFLVDGNEKIGFENHGASLQLRSRATTDKHGTASSTCSSTFTVSELENGDLDVSGSRWFAKETDCVAAFKSKQRVAMDWSSCTTFGPDATLQQQAASQRTFEAMLHFGGVAFMLDGTRCRPLHATPSRGNTYKSFEGELWSRIPGGRTGYGYQLAANAMDIVLLGPHSESVDNGGFGMLCGDEQSISYGHDTVLLGETIYLSLASCSAARRKERARLSLLPLQNSEAPVAMTAGSLGGC